MLLLKSVRSSRSSLLGLVLKYPPCDRDRVYEPFVGLVRPRNVIKRGRKVANNEAITLVPTSTVAIIALGTLAHKKSSVSVNI
jgi:hypothetical protein